MSVIQVNQIKSRIEAIYKDKIDLTNVQEKDKENCFLSRAFAAYSLQVLADLEPDIAVQAIVDSYDDNGIDALCYNSKTSELWIVQSKWIKKGIGEPEVGETNKFTKGIKDLIELKFDRFNDKVKSKIPDIEAALDDLKIKIKIVLAYTGADTLSVHNQRVINDLLEEVNEASELMEFSKFSLKQGIKALINLLDGQPINIDIVLQNWGKIESPYNVFYGIIDGITLAQLWNNHKTRLLSDNIREFIGNTSVNTDIKETALRNPEHFFYFNNGVTALCDNITKKAVGGATHSVGQFVVENIKINNVAESKKEQSVANQL